MCQELCFMIYKYAIYPSLQLDQVCGIIPILHSGDESTVRESVKLAQLLSPYDRWRNWDKSTYKNHTASKQSCSQLGIWLQSLYS